MPDRPPSLQDQFLNAARRAKTPLTIFLVKGVKLQGIITWFDNFSLLLRREGASQLVYKHSISTIQPHEAVPGFEPGRPDLPTKPQLQDVLLAAALDQREPMTVFLMNGVMLQGYVTGFDQFAIVLERAPQQQLVYKHAMSTLQPAQGLDLQGEDDEGADG